VRYGSLGLGAGGLAVHRTRSRRQSLNQAPGGVLRNVTNLAGQIWGMRSRICQDIRVSDLAVSLRVLA
jgi:hypothetical protein